MRELSEKFMSDLLESDGLLHPILARVRQDDTLLLAIRENYINIYYRGGNLLKIREEGKGLYTSFFEENYGETGPIKKIENQSDSAKWIKAFPHLKEAMDFHFFKHRKPEREFQQLIARENNFSTISNETEYFITDIELADSNLKARFDMLAILWPASQRKNGSKCRPALIEMKYSDGALGGDSSLLKHLQDIEKFITNSIKYKELLNSMENQFNQLQQLGLLNLNQCKNGAKIKLNNDKPEVIFILANHNPRSSKLNTILDEPKVLKYSQSEFFDLKFFVSRFAGYGLHKDCILSLNQFINFLKS